MSTSRRGRPRLSVVLPLNDPWPAGRPSLDLVLDQATDDIEIVVPYNSGGGVGVAQAARVVIEPHPGASIFELRREGVKAARGDVIAIIEDHCLVAPDWCASVLRSHAEHPTATAIAGAVLNGAEDKLIDRASFFIVHSANLPGRTKGPNWLPSAANISFKRSDLPPLPARAGWLELVHTPQLVREGRVLVDERIVVRHVQSLGLAGTFAAHFHAARAGSGLLALDLPGHERRRLARTALRHPRNLLANAVAVARERPDDRNAVWSSMPYAVPLAAAGGAGFVLGFLAGPGSSPEKVA